MHCYCILLAAGAGKRLNQGIPKAFVSYDGIPILIRSYQTIQKSNLFHKCIVVVPEGYAEDAARLGISKTQTDMIVGGEERYHSVQNALKIINTDHKIPDNQIYVAIHDAARCFVSVDVLQRSIDAVKIHNAVTVAIPMTDSVKEVDAEGKVIRSLKRSALWQIQTPQVFRFDLLKRAHSGIENEIEVTDDASFVERFHPVHVVRGEVKNRKVTVAEDLKRSEG